MAKTNTKDASTTEAIRARKSLRKKMERKGMLPQVKPYTPEPWPAEDKTPRNGMCNLAGGKFAILPNNGKKMFNWVKKDPS